MGPIREWGLQYAEAHNFTPGHLQYVGGADRAPRLYLGAWGVRPFLPPTPIPPSLPLVPLLSVDVGARARAREGRERQREGGGGGG